MNSVEVRYQMEDLAFNDSEDALRALYVHYRERLRRYVFLYVKSEEVTGEIVSDVFVAIWENRKYMPEVDNPEAYIYRIAKFKSLNYLRSKTADTVDLDEMKIDLFANTGFTPEDSFISNETIDALNNAIDRLPPQCKMAFKLVREDHMKYKDAANHLGISVKTLEAHLSVAVKKIRGMLSAKTLLSAPGKPAVRSKGKEND